MITTHENQYSSNCIYRPAFNPNGRVGSRYDGRLDKLITHTPILLPTTTDNSKKIIQCRLIKNLSGENFNLMNELNIHHDLRLSIVLKLSSDDTLNKIIFGSPPMHQFTHVIRYTAITRTEYLPRENYEKLVETKPSVSGTFGTHVILRVNYGIDALFMFNFNKEDDLLEKICYIMENNAELRFTSDENLLLEKINAVKCWSNENELGTCRTISEFYQVIQKKMKQTHDSHPPYNYLLCPIPELYSISNAEQLECNCISQPYVEKIEQRILWLFRQTNDLSEKVNPVSLGHEDYQADFDEINRLYTEEVEKFKLTVNSIRECSEHESILDQILTDDETVQQLREKINNLSRKLDFIFKKTSLQKGVFESIVATSDDNDDDDDQSDSDRANISPVQQTENDSSHQLINSDFLKVESISSVPTISSSNVNEEKIFNILLFGESGAGKSTFINALVNYLRFDTFEQAEKSEPIVLLPISFMVTTGHDFEEHQVTYSGLDDGCKEIHGEEGQSVTQHCRSYLFTIKDDQQRERKVRLIDTPGLGDTRGIEQDEKNLQQIIAYINQLTYLHAVCIVLRPNIARFNVSFRLCLTKFFDLFGENASEFIFFCFTNTRSTFYSPGNTGPLVRQFLETLPRKRPLPFEKKNIFCFDSESFRYLVAAQRGVQFNSESADACKTTWYRSSIQSKRLIRTVLQQQNTYEVCQDEKFMEKASRAINFNIRTTLKKMKRLFPNQKSNGLVSEEKGQIRNPSTTDERDPTDLKQIALRNSDADVTNDFHRGTNHHRKHLFDSVLTRLIDELNSDSRLQIITDKIKNCERFTLGRHEFQVPVSNLHLNILT